MLTIGITTYKYRFEKYILKLIPAIRKQTDAEIILAINGEYKEPFSEEYRKNILRFSAEYPGIYPFLYPNFRSLSKMWNNIIINATGDYVLVLNDDMEITDPFFIKKVIANCERVKWHFTINCSYSNFVIRKDVMDPMSWFDERYLGIGCEDHEFRRRNSSGIVQIHNVSMDGFKELCDYDNAIKNHRIENGKYSRFNRDLLLKDLKVVPQYPHEQFYRDHYNEL